MARLLGQTPMRRCKLGMCARQIAMGRLKLLVLPEHVGTRRPGDDERTHDAHQKAQAADGGVEKRQHQRGNKDGAARRGDRYAKALEDYTTHTHPSIAGLMATSSELQISMLAKICPTSSCMDFIVPERLMNIHPAIGFYAIRPIMTQIPDASRFAHVTDWVFDLDNTLYPHHTNLFSQIDVRMTSYVSELLTLSREDARVLQKELYREHGTTLNGLMKRYNIDPDDFLMKVHDIDYSWLVPDPVLGAAIHQLPGRRFIFTNGDRTHAERAARQLGILDHFDDIFDIIAADLTPKPDVRTYEKFTSLHSVIGDNAVMFEDIARNLAVPKQMGMTTVLVVPNNFEPTFSEIWESDPDHEDDVDYVTDDLAGFLEKIIAAR
jgi:putative hydrolase of the HAD superfamily